MSCGTMFLSRWLLLGQMRLNKVSELIHNSTNHQNLDKASVSVHFQEIIDLVFYVNHFNFLTCNVLSLIFCKCHWFHVQHSLCICGSDFINLYIILILFTYSFVGWWKLWDCEHLSIEFELNGYHLSLLCAWEFFKA